MRHCAEKNVPRQNCILLACACHSFTSHVALRFLDGILADDYLLLALVTIRVLLQVIGYVNDGGAFEEDDDNGAAPGRGDEIDEVL
jgi:hypothetical protein